MWFLYPSPGFPILLLGRNGVVEWREVRREIDVPQTSLSATADISPCIGEKNNY